MGDFVTNSETSLAVLKDECQLLLNVMHDVLLLEVDKERLEQVWMLQPCFSARRTQRPTFLPAPFTAPRTRACVFEDGVSIIIDLTLVGQLDVACLLSAAQLHESMH